MTTGLSGTKIDMLGDQLRAAHCSVVLVSWMLRRRANGTATQK